MDIVHIKKENKIYQDNLILSFIDILLTYYKAQSKILVIDLTLSFCLVDQ